MCTVTRKSNENYRSGQNEDKNGGLFVAVFFPRWWSDFHNGVPSFTKKKKLLFIPMLILTINYRKKA